MMRSFRLRHHRVQAFVRSLRLEHGGGRKERKGQRRRVRHEAGTFFDLLFESGDSAGRSRRSVLEATPTTTAAAAAIASATTMNVLRIMNPSYACMYRLERETFDPL